MIQIAYHRSMAIVNKKAVYPEKWTIGIDEVGRAAKKSEPRPRWIIGIDEVGRGPLAGPVMVAAVAASVNYESGIMNHGLKGIRDSKKLSPSKRELWNKIIKQKFLYAVVSVSNSHIDKKGITYTCSFAVNQVLKKLLSRNPIIHNSKFMIQLDGGLHAPPEYKHQQTLIRGDERVPIIAAASIVAKVHRDRYMVRLHKKYPLYGFDRHKGDGTAAHREVIIKNGLSDVHRKSFCKNLHYVDEMI